MHWSKGILSKNSADKKVLEYSPLKIELGTASQALDYLNSKQFGTDFVMGDPTKVQTGVDKIEEVSYEEKIEHAAIEKLKIIQEKAYKEAYDLGLEEGKILSFERHHQVIEEKLASLDQLLTTIGKLKSELVSFNEAHLMKILFHMAAKLAMNQIKQEPMAVIELIKSASMLAQEDEQVTVLVSPDQIEFIEELKLQTKREFEFLKKIKLVSSTEVSVGGCIVETNYGEVDARVEQRVEQLWLNLLDNIPQTKDRIAG